jgi:hypothetical protein
MQVTKQQIDQKAMELFEENRGAGTLKEAPGLFAGSIGRGPIRSASSTLTWRDYRREARAWFANRA